MVYDPSTVDLGSLLKTFWEAHDPTQGMRQGADVGTQYRSAVYWTTPGQFDTVNKSQAIFAQALKHMGLGAITTEVSKAPTFFYAEGYHQQYLSKNPAGYCGLKGTGAVCPADL